MGHFINKKYKLHYPTRKQLVTSAHSLFLERRPEIAASVDKHWRNTDHNLRIKSGDNEIDD